MKNLFMAFTLVVISVIVVFANGKNLNKGGTKTNSPGIESANSQITQSDSLPSGFDKWTVKDKVDFLMGHMTFTEKVDEMNTSPRGEVSPQQKPDKRFGIPGFVSCDGPRGVRGAATGVCYPVALSMAASWDTSLAQKVGKAFGEQLIHYKANQIFAPAVNIIKNPLAGRNAEYLGEDPFLSGTMGAAEIKGIQSKGCIATVKHFACNSFETGRFVVNATVGERVMREIYLPAFRMCVQDGGAKSLMTAYNSVNGHFASANMQLMNILYKEWGFKGYVVSDWGANMENTAAALKAGVNVEMPGWKYYNDKNIEEGLKDGTISQKLFNRRVRRILELKMDPSFYNPDKPNTPDVYNLDSQRKLAAEVSENSIVLLKNNRDVLPLNETQTVALIGPFANSELLVGNQQSSTVFPERVITVKQVLEERLGNKMIYSEGCNALLDENEKLFSKFQCKAEYYNNLDCKGEPALIRNENSIMKLFYSGSGAASSVQDIKNQANESYKDIKYMSARWTGTFIPHKTGKYYFSVDSNGGVRFYINGRKIFDQWQEAWIEGKNRQCWISMEKGKKYVLRIEYTNISEQRRNGHPFIRFQYAKPDENQLKMIEEAVAAAKKQNVAIVVVGIPQIPLQGEANDRETYSLSSYQDELIQAVAAVNPNTIVVLCSAGGVNMQLWLSKVAALVEAFYPGQEGGYSVFNVLYGKVNPSGRLPVTYPVSTKQLEVNVVQPIFETTVCGFGYRMFDKENKEPQFPFGFGLSYTTFSYNELSIKREKDDNVNVSFEITNTGKRIGAEVAQLYIHAEKSSVERPVRELKGFQKVFLKPGETKVVSIKLNPIDFAFYDVNEKAWHVEAGKYDIQIGSSVDDIKLTHAIEMDEKIIKN